MPAAFGCRLREFGSSTMSEKLGRIIATAAGDGFATHYMKQTEAWQQEIEILGQAAANLQRRLSASSDWRLFFEFEIPRRAKRPDVILIARDLIFIIEFKIGAKRFDSAAIWQALSYALDIRDFHLASKGRRIIPVLIATKGAPSRVERATVESFVAPVIRVGSASGADLAECIEQLYAEYHDAAATPIDSDRWVTGPYRPVPTIIEAAEQLFAGHSVAEISHSFATNLDATSRTLVEAIQTAQARHQRIICFVTGIPGAGKTLTGLNAVHNSAVREEGRPAAVFLSGNGPLVKIVRAALVRDRQRAGYSCKEAARTVSTFIGNVHQFVRTYGMGEARESPYENAIVFDEAQRAWDIGAVKKKYGIHKSEPELVLDIMERAANWSVVIALVGGGQEIHDGEAGLEEWGNALCRRQKAWTVMVSPDALRGGASTSGHRLFLSDPPMDLSVVQAPELHLNVSVRSPRARRIANWVNALLSEEPLATLLEASESAEFPLALTREQDTARNWLRDRTDGAQRCGLLASSGALRLRADGIEVSSEFRKGYPYEEWFLGDYDDTRSSYWLEVAATEFECQGLELDWTGVCWGGDFLRDPHVGQWRYRRFWGSGWRVIRQERAQQYLRNKYRVLLTRARQGMVIWIPRGNPDDPTRAPASFDATAEHLKALGVPEI